MFHGEAHCGLAKIEIFSRLLAPDSNIVKPILKSTKLSNVCYDIRGPVMERSKQMEEEGQRIIKLNIGNLAPFGF